MVPYQGRSAIRVARVVLALCCLAWYPFTGGAHFVLAGFPDRLRDFRGGRAV